MASMEQDPDFDRTEYWGTRHDSWWCYMLVLTMILLVGAIL